MKKKASLQRQDMYRTGGGPSNAPEFSDVEEKVLSISSNIKGLEARHDSDTISIPVPAEEAVLCPFDISSTDTPEEHHETENTTQASVQIPEMDDSFILEVVEDNDSQKENKWNRWQPKALKTRVSNALKAEVATKASVTSNLDKLSEARLELVQLQMEIARKQHQFMEEEHKLKMQHLANDERRKEAIHALLMEK